ncbi:MAG: coproporphyrinogen dehydrogenase HemZ [Oscillospiraceae bacterium]|nr:coproporphyrinogen dehydrogenase HemZ [Oscillospiraceae bacterium]
MLIYVKGFKSSYDIEHLTRLFYPDAAITANGTHYPKTECVVARKSKNKIMVGVRTKDKTYVRVGKVNLAEKPSFTASAMLYHLLKQITGKRPSWGMLTGVRPVRLIHDMWAEGKTDAEISNRFLTSFDVTDEKYKLAMGTAKLQKQVMCGSNVKSYSLYVSIPFCPSRCSYCSFVSRTTAGSQKLIQPYVDKLCLEIAEISRVAQQNDLHLHTIYIGGGTPTALSAAQLRQVMQAIKENFDIARAEEYTVEAGRPDCTDEEKLSIIKEMGATRVSINPQTLNDTVLKAIGRRHSVQDVIDCYHIARKLGHNNINMDLIAGLPLDTVDSFAKSLQGVIALAPENITVHTLTLKRASNLVIEHSPDAYDDVSKMLEYNRLLGQAGYAPYYLYRQKNTLDNLENTGFAKPGFEGLYNIYIMEEVHSILSAGAGGVTKLKSPAENRIERIFNHKYPLEYTENFAEMLRRKQQITTFFSQLSENEV